MALDPPVLDGTDQVARGDTFLKLRGAEFATAVSYSVHCGPHVRVFTIPDVPFATEFTGLPSNTPFALSLEAVLENADVLHSDEVTVFTRPRPPAFVLLDDPAELARRS